MATDRITKHGVNVAPKRAQNTRDLFYEMDQLGLTACFGNSHMTLTEMIDFLKTLSPSQL